MPSSWLSRMTGAIQSLPPPLGSVGLRTCWLWAPLVAGGAICRGHRPPAFAGSAAPELRSALPDVGFLSALEDYAMVCARSKSASMTKPESACVAQCTSQTKPSSLQFH